MDFLVKSTLATKVAPGDKRIWNLRKGRLSSDVFFGATHFSALHLTETKRHGHNGQRRKFEESLVSSEFHLGKGHSS